MVIRLFLARGLIRGALGLSIAGVWTFYEGIDAKAQTSAPLHFFHVAPGALSDAVLTFSQQAHVQVTADAESLDHHTSAGVSGQFTLAAGLQKILAGTGLTYHPVGKGAFQIVAAPHAPQEQTGLTKTQDPHSAEGSSTSSYGGTERIVVVGQSMDRLKNTNSAVTVLRHLDTDEYRSLYDVTNRVPNMVGNAAGLPAIRGMSGEGAAGGIFTLMSGSRPRTAVIIDGLPETFGGQRYTDSGLWDFDDVQVLRGPQATTQGRNAIGGAITMNTKDPTWAWHGAVHAGYESQGDRGSFGATLSGPLVKDQLAIRLSGNGIYGNSYIKYAGKSWPYNPSEINQSTFRGKMLWTPKALPRFKMEMVGSHREQNGEYLYQATGPDFWKYKFDNPDMNIRVSNSSIDTLSDKFSYEISDALTASLLYGHVWYDANFNQSNQLASSNSRGKLNLNENNNTIEQRFVYSPKNGWINGVLGLYYFNRDQRITSPDMGVNGPDQEQTYAIYMDGTVPLIGGLSLIAGARVEREVQNRNVRMSWGSVNFDGGTTMFLPKGGLLYTFSPHDSMSFTVRRGYNPGGGAIDWDRGFYYQYKKETVTTYELSGHTEQFGRRFSLNGNLFYNSFHNYQDLLDYTFVNIPDGRSMGLELEAQYHVTKGLNIYGGVGLLDTKIQKAPTAYAYAKGSKFSNAPSTTFTVGFDQKFQSGFSFGGTVNRVGAYTSQVENGTGITAGNYITFNMHAAYTSKYYTVRFYAKNLSNEHIIYNARSSWAGSYAQVGQPRAFGASLEGHF